MKNTFTIIIFTMMSLSLEAQTNSFSLEGKALYSRNFSTQTQRVSTSESSSVFLDQLGNPIFIEQNPIDELTSDYQAKIGFEISGLIRLSPIKRFTFKTGFGLNYFSFEKQRRLNGPLGLVNGGSLIPLNGQLTEECDVINTGFLFINNIDDADYSIFSLRLPLMISYEIMEGDFFIEAGIYIQAPVFSNFENTENIFHQTLTNNATICDLEQRNTIDKSGDAFNNIQTGVLASVNYRINEDFVLKLGVQKDLDNLFDPSYERPEAGSSHVGISVEGFSEEYAPLKFFVGAEYALRKK